MPETIGASAIDPCQSTHFRSPRTWGVTAIRSGTSFLRSCRCCGTGFRVIFTQSARMAVSFAAKSVVLVRNASAGALLLALAGSEPVDLSMSDEEAATIRRIFAHPGEIWVLDPDEVVGEIRRHDRK